MFIKENVIFTDNYIMAQLSADPFGVSITLAVYEIISDLNSQPSNHDAPTLPYGICNIGIDELKQRLLEYINVLSRRWLSADEMIKGDTSEITWRILGAVCRFHNANPIAKKVSTYPTY
jgi:hypothetical protein